MTSVPAPWAGLLLPLIVVAAMTFVIFVLRWKELKTSLVKSLLVATPALALLVLMIALMMMT